MKRVYLWLTGITVFALTLVANAGAASACAILFHEPEVPQQLRQK